MREEPVMFDAIAIGELLIDFACLSTDGDLYPTMAAHPGGAPANFLAAMGHSFSLGLPRHYRAAENVCPP